MLEERMGILASLRFQKVDPFVSVLSRSEVIRMTDCCISA